MTPTNASPVVRQGFNGTLGVGELLRLCRRSAVSRGMYFKLANQPFDLTADDVRTLLRGQLPEDIRDYWVEINGVRWPVKQVIGLATGIERRRFQSQNSRRLLNRLGFTVGMGSTMLEGQGASSANARVPRAAFDIESLPKADSLDMSVGLTWRTAGPVTLDADRLPAFPRLPREPGLYRFEFGTDFPDTRRLYIGESVDLARRASNYRNAKTDRSRQRTSRRIHKEIVGHLSAGGSIEFAIATSASWSEDGALDFRRKSARHLAESAAVLVAQIRPGTTVLNIDADLTEGESDDE